MYDWRYVCVCMCMSVLCLRGRCIVCVTFPALAFSYLFMVGESNQNVFFIQTDASSFAEFEISGFEISRFDCSLFFKKTITNDNKIISLLKRFIQKHSLWSIKVYLFSVYETCIKYKMNCQNTPNQDRKHGIYECCPRNLWTFFDSF